MIDGLFTTTSAYIAHSGIGRIAWELALLKKYALEPEQAIPFFYDKLLSNNQLEVRDAQKIYFVLGAHIAMPRAKARSGGELILKNARASIASVLL